MNLTPGAWRSQRRGSIQWVCMCLVTMTAFLGAGIRPVIGNRRGSGATPKSTLLTLKGFPLYEPATPPRLPHPHSHPHPLPKTMFVRLSEEFLHRDAVMKMLVSWHEQECNIPLCWKQTVQEVAVRVEHLFVHKQPIPGWERGFLLQDLATSMLLPSNNSNGIMELVSIWRIVKRKQLLITESFFYRLTWFRKMCKYVSNIM